MKWDQDLYPISNQQLLSGELAPVVMVPHDECTFNVNDGRHFIWTYEDHQPLRKKGRGQGLHVSDLLTPIGRLEDGAACEIWKCRGDIWWDGEKLLEHIKTKAIPLFQAEFPGCRALVLFDNAKTPSKYADDALRVSKMNLADGGKHAKKMRTTYVLDRSHPQGGYFRSIILEDATPKGLKTVLTERGLWPTSGEHFLTQCCIITPAGNTTPNSRCLKGGTCCARALLASQPDFKALRGELEKAIEAAGHMILFYPAFHCELNFIEYFWGAAKRYTRLNCGYDFPSLQHLVSEALAQVPNTLIWKYHTKTQRIIAAYECGEVYGSQCYKNLVSKRYKSHRRSDVSCAYFFVSFTFPLFYFLCLLSFVHFPMFLSLFCFSLSHSFISFLLSFRPCSPRHFYSIKVTFMA